MKQLLRLYPKRWRDRYADEVGALLESRRMSVSGVVDLLLGALDAHLHPAAVPGLVFVPNIGFRPGGTRTLLEHAEASADATRLTVVAVAATPQHTELLVEWERTHDTATCEAPAAAPAPAEGGPRPGPIGAPPMRAPSSSVAPEPKLRATLVAGDTALEATSMARNAYDSNGWALRTMVFPALPREARAVELQMRAGERSWNIPLTLRPGGIDATPLAAEAQRDGIAIRATALTWHDDQLIVAVEATAARPIGQIGAPSPPLPAMLRRRRLKAPPGLSWDPIVLEDDRGNHVEELGRLPSARDLPERHLAGEPYVQRFSVFFPLPRGDARMVTMVVPFVEVTDLEPSVVADLRDLPSELDLGAHRMRIVRADAYPGSSARGIQLEIPQSGASPRFVRPASVQGTPPGGYSWSSGPHGEPFWMETSVGEPPLVTFRGVVLRYDGPWRLHVPLPA